MSLGRRNETNRSVYIITRGKTLKEALKRGCKIIQDDNEEDAVDPKDKTVIREGK